MNIKKIFKCLILFGNIINMAIAQVSKNMKKKENWSQNIAAFMMVRVCISAKIRRDRKNK